MRRRDCHERINQVKGSFQTAFRTVNALIRIATDEPKYLYNHDLDLGAMRDLVRELGDLYFVRMFACFESSLRHYWRATVRNTKPLTEQLISSVAGRRGVPQDTVDAVHEIREYRNYLTHEETEINKRFTMEEASSHLNTFLARLPLQW